MTPSSAATTSTAHVAAVREYLDAGYDEVYVNQIGPRQQDFFDFYGKEVLPRLRQG
ncbi:hypothetical protein [Actinopolymorpha pittospori]|uniref:Luciferase-like monooxygenase n=1 Tax=Actinopolymorpha pittospori TaxID=648752 RepID=A0A927MNG0_9ACTN|nr:hypothetical protein [Actinopolymorpha pittospori]MBE1603461.1 hypothetical protein [Actinopolymorpha pittospori]